MKIIRRYSALIVISFAVGAQATDFSVYGFLKAGMVTASRAVDSYGSTNLSAPIRVMPNGDSTSAEARSSFQLSQSRVGVNLGKKESVSGQIELDFIDFDKATPVTKAVPRLRIAAIRYAANENNTITIGQDWDVFSPVKPFTFNYVGLYFGAGNAGFMRPQVKWSHKGDALNFDTAIGLSGSNATATDADLERGLLPTFAAAVSHEADAMLYGVSFLVGKLRLTSGAVESNPLFYGVNGFFQVSGSFGEAHLEAYYGQSLGNSGALTLALATLSGAPHEAGGYLTWKYGLGPAFGLQLGAGYATVMDGGSTSRGITGFEVLDNIKLSASGAYHLTSNLDLFLELTGLSTKFVEDATGDSFRRNALIGETGAVLNF